MVYVVSCSIVIPARAFTRSLYNMQVGLKKHYYRAKVTKQIKKDLQVWKTFLLEYNYHTFFLDFRWQSSVSLQLYSDAASTIGNWFLCNFWS